MDGTLSQDLIDELNNHLKQCKKCSVIFKTYSLTITLSKRVEEPCCLSREMTERLRSLLYNRFFPK